MGIEHCFWFLVFGLSCYGFGAPNSISHEKFPYYRFPVSGPLDM